MSFEPGVITSLIARFTAALTPAFMAAAKEIEPKFYDFILAEMNTGGAPPKGVRSTSNRLYVRSGTLSNAWRTGQPGNATTITADDKGVHIRFGNDVVYARVHEYGSGAIPARPSMTPAQLALQQSIVPILGAALASRVVAAWQGVGNA